MFYRWYITPYKLSRMYKNVSNACYRCGEVGSMYHVWWECNKIEIFWNDIHSELETILKIRFPKSAEAEEFFDCWKHFKPTLAQLEPGTLPLRVPA